jgi:GntR family transcriptional regulator
MSYPSRDLGASLHHQVSAVLRSGIMSGRYGEGEYLPGEEKLTEMFGVSRPTIRRAMLSLEQEGLIERKQGRGTRVVWNRRVSTTASPLSEVINSIGQMDRDSTVKVLAFDEGPIPEEPRTSLRLPQNARGVRVVRRRQRGDEPLWMMINYFPAAIGERFTADTFERFTMFEALRQIGRPCKRAVNVVSATLADPEFAGILEIRIGSPLIEMTRVAEDATGEIVAYQVTMVPPERHKLRIVNEADDAEADQNTLSPWPSQAG